MTQPQTWKSTPFTIEAVQGKSAGTLIFRLRGPFTARDMYGSLAPVALDTLLNFESAPSVTPPTLNILDLSEVPYMDSAGLGRIVRHYVHCRARNIQVIAAAPTPLVVQLFTMTKVANVIPIVPTLAAADL